MACQCLYLYPAKSWVRLGVCSPAVPAQGSLPCRALAALQAVQHSRARRSRRRCSRARRAGAAGPRAAAATPPAPRCRPARPRAELCCPCCWRGSPRLRAAQQREITVRKQQQPQSCTGPGAAAPPEPQEPTRPRYCPIP